MVNGIWDGRGFEQVTKTQEAGSLAGCNVCHFLGVRFANTNVYPHYNQYLPVDDTRRLRRPIRVPNHSAMYNMQRQVAGPPAERSYEKYILNGESF